MIVITPENIAWTDYSLRQKITEVEETTHDRKIDDSRNATTRAGWELGHQ